MIDRKNRDYLIELVNKFLNCEISAFKFDDLIHKIHSEDKTIDHVVFWLWHFYDDCTDHYADLAKEEWDYIQRLLLILQTDSEIVREYVKLRWSRLIAMFLLLALAYSFYFYKWESVQFFIAWISGSVIGYMLHLYRNKKLYKSMNVSIFPFESYVQLAAVRRRNGLKKTLFFRRKTAERVREWWIIETAEHSAFLRWVYNILWTFLCYGILWPIMFMGFLVFDDNSFIRIMYSPENITVPNGETNKKQYSVCADINAEYDFSESKKNPYAAPLKK